jgi:hypothetical protein
MIKFLPLALMVFCVDRRSAINPHRFGLTGGLATFMTAKSMGVYSLFDPVWRRWIKSFHDF